MSSIQFPMPIQSVETEEDGFSSTQPCDESSDIQEVFPRIGPEYQAVIPSLHSCTMRAQYISGEEKCTVHQKFLEGLTVPTMWITYSNLVPIDSDTEQDLSTSVSVGDGVEKQTEKIRKNKCQLDVPEFSRSRFADKHGDYDVINSSQGNTDSSMEDRKDNSLTQFELEQQISQDSLHTLASKVDRIPSPRRRKRKRGRRCWGKCKRGNSVSSMSSKQKADTNTCYEKRTRKSIMVPGSLCATWAEIEENAFILALYIFGKNFVAVKNFIESKDMNSIHNYYYGKFYGTESYCRWAESRKIRSRKCFQGQRLFSGWRLQELAIRLIPHVAEDLKDKIPLAMREFGEGKLPIEVFLKELKSLVGLAILIQAVGIGKGSHDLTAALMDPMKTNQLVSRRCEIPIGKACSSLSTEEVVKFLSGDYRLSKSRSNDLFWEAVWPRLLARGWHSEQPNEQTKLNTKNSLIFFVPEDKNCTRKDFLKGVHYFDSISEVLSKVSSDPRLLDPLQNANGDMLTSKKKPEYLPRNDIVEEHSDRSKETPCYLKPKYCSNYAAPFLFTVIDTSLALEIRDLSNVREARALPKEDLSEYLLHMSEEEESSSGKIMELQMSSHLVDAPNTSPANSNLLAVSKDRPSYGTQIPSSQFHGSNHHSIVSTVSGDCMTKISTENLLSAKVRKETIILEDLNRTEKKSISSDENAPIDDRKGVSFTNKITNESKTASIDNFTKSDRGPLITYSSKSLRRKQEKDPYKAINENDSSLSSLGRNTVYPMSCSFRIKKKSPLGVSSASSAPLTFDAHQKVFNIGDNDHVEHLKAIENHMSSKSELQSFTDFTWVDSRKIEENYHTVKDQRHLDDFNSANSCKSNNFLQQAALSDSLCDTTSSHCNERLTNLKQKRCGGETEDETVIKKVHENTIQTEGRRQSTRARPLTVKALEAFASGFYGTKRRRGGKINSSTENSHLKFFSRQLEDQHKTSQSDRSSEHNDIYGHETSQSDRTSAHKDITVVDTSMLYTQENKSTPFDFKPQDGYKKQKRTHVVMKISKRGICSETLDSEKKNDNVSGMLISEISY